jgi:hypothetical protein
MQHPGLGLFFLLHINVVLMQFLTSIVFSGEVVSLMPPSILAAFPLARLADLTLPVAYAPSDITIHITSVH